MRLLTAPVRVLGAFIAWALAVALVMGAEIIATGGHVSGTPAIAVPVLALFIGAAVGTVFWTLSRRRLVPAVLMLIALCLSFVALVVAGGAALKG